MNPHLRKSRRGETLASVASVASVAAVLLVAAAVPGQDKPRASVLLLDGKALDDPVAVYDPRGLVEIRGGAGDLRRRWRIVVPMLGRILPGTHTVGSGGKNVVAVSELNGEAWTPLESGRLEVAACGRRRVEGTLQVGAGSATHTLQFGLTPRTARVEPAHVRGAREVGFPRPVDEPRRADLVFGAVANTGTGMAGAEQVVQQMGKLASTGPLDFMLLPGGAFLPHSVVSVTDRQWDVKFEKLFDVRDFGVPCYFVGAPPDRKHWSALIDYGKFNMRWTMPAHAYDFEVTSHGKKFLFVAMDTTSVSGELGDGTNRSSIRNTRHTLATTEADWKIVFGSAAMFTGGPGRRGPRTRLLRNRMGSIFSEFDVDVYICGAERVTELVTPRGTAVHVTAGGGGGAELADSVVWGAETRYAFTGGGFAWFRFNGVDLEISLRDVEGKVRYVHRLRKQ